MTCTPVKLSKYKRDCVSIINILLKKLSCSFLPMLTEIIAPSRPLQQHLHCEDTLCSTECHGWLAETGRSDEFGLGTNLFRFTPPCHDWHPCSMTDPLALFTITDVLLAEKWHNNKRGIWALVSCALGIWVLVCHSCVLWHSQSHCWTVLVVFVPQLFWPVRSSFVLQCFFSTVSSTEIILRHWHTPSYCIVYTNI